MKKEGASMMNGYGWRGGRKEEGNNDTKYGRNMWCLGLDKSVTISNGS